MEYFYYLNAYRVLVCRTCITSVTKRRISLHRLIKDEINKAVTVDIIKNPDNIKTLKLRRPRENRYYKTGSYCPFIGIDLHRIREHLKAIHTGRYLQIENQIKLAQEEGVRKAAGRFIAKAARICKKEVENVNNLDKFLALNA
ncbi:hypothetical protein LZ30DRAFT_752769 [Colletotrichum cereale]|nr:hypothetical protein LZ30DRAFT_752769 [Colletotrichum cereale]